MQNKEPKVVAIQVELEVYQRVVSVLSSLPYNQISGLMRQLEAHSLPIYEPQLGNPNVPEPAKEVEEEPSYTDQTEATEEEGEPVDYPLDPPDSTL